MVFLSEWYLWIKTFHIISVISWMAGLLYLPRIFIYHTEISDYDVKNDRIFIVMEKKLFHFIMSKAMISTWFFGILLILTPGIVNFSVFGWFYIKLILVIFMTGFHIWLGKRQDDFENHRNTLTSRTFRLLNEVPAVIMVLIVIMVIVKPF